MKKEKFTLEFVFNASPGLLYEYLSTPSGLSEWFSDNVNSRGKNYKFIWDDVEEDAVLVKSKPDKYIRFQWVEDMDTDYYFEFSIEQDDLTGDISLIVVDFAEESDLEAAKQLWENQVEDLKKVLGS